MHGHTHTRIPNNFRSAIIHDLKDPWRHTHTHIHTPARTNTMYAHIEIQRRGNGMSFTAFVPPQPWGEPHHACAALVRQ